MNEWMQANSIWVALGLTVLVAVYFLIEITQALRKKRPATGPIGIILLSVGLLFAIFLLFRADELEPASLAQMILTIGLIMVTAAYAGSAEKQATANVKMAKEMREQRYDTVRPVIDIYRDPADEDKMQEALEGTSGDASRGLSCVLKNIGLGPAIDVYSFVQNPFSGERQRHEFGTLAIGEITFRMKLSLIYEDKPLALVAYYRDVYGRAFVSIREVSADEKKGWQIGPLQTRPVT
jgi:hypothetical protein